MPRIARPRDMREAATRISQATDDAQQAAAG
jgi:hypothetical protein